ncbi:MAG: MBL fold metallo-hydrolase [Promethearchaeota archaeon]
MLNYIDLGEGIYLAKENTKRVNIINAIVIDDDLQNNSILIDANYPFKFIDELYNKIESPAKALIFSHCHTDHMAHGFYHQEKYKTPLYCPIQEKEQILSLNALMDNAGFTKLGLTDTFKKMVIHYMKFKEPREVKTFIPGKDVFKYKSVKIETIHIPGHSPGHTAFIIDPIKHKENRKILYVSDIGSHPYYGDLNCNLSKYYNSIDKLEQIYLSGDYILIPAHGRIYKEKNELFFDRIRVRIKNNEKKIINALDKNKPKSIKELVLEGTITPVEKMNPYIKDLYFLWDGGMIYQHLQELVENKIVRKISEKGFLKDKYILV